MLKTGNERWDVLYRAGAIAPLITLFFYLCQFVFISWDVYPQSTMEWFSLFERSPMTGFFYLNSLDIISVSLLGVMILALSRLLKTENAAWTTIATPFAFIGIGVFIVPRVELLAINTLTQQYLSAVTELEKTEILAAGRAISVLGIPTIQTAGFFILAVAMLIISCILIRSNKGKITGYTGVAAFLLTLACDISTLFSSSLGTMLLVAAGFLWVAWWVMISVRLFRAARAQKNVSQ